MFNDKFFASLYKVLKAEKEKNGKSFLSLVEKSPKGVYLKKERKILIYGFLYSVFIKFSTTQQVEI
jgi:hypothetical protein